MDKTSQKRLLRVASLLEAAIPEKSVNQLYTSIKEAYNHGKNALLDKDFPAARLQALYIDKLLGKARTAGLDAEKVKEVEKLLNDLLKSYYDHKVKNASTKTSSEQKDEDSSYEAVNKIFDGTRECVHLISGMKEDLQKLVDISTEGRTRLDRLLRDADQALVIVNSSMRNHGRAKKEATEKKNNITLKDLKYKKKLSNGLLIGQPNNIEAYSDNYYIYMYPKSENDPLYALPRHGANRQGFELLWEAEEVAKNWFNAPYAE